MIDEDAQQAREEFDRIGYADIATDVWIPRSLWSDITANAVGMARTMAMEYAQAIVQDWPPHTLSMMNMDSFTGISQRDGVYTDDVKVSIHVRVIRI